MDMFYHLSYNEGYLIVQKTVTFLYNILLSNIPAAKKEKKKKLIRYWLQERKDEGKQNLHCIRENRYNPYILSALFFVFYACLVQLLTWMHRKFRQGNGETLKEFPIGNSLTFLSIDRFSYFSGSENSLL